VTQWKNDKAEPKKGNLERKASMPDPIGWWEVCWSDPTVNQMPGVLGTVNADANTKDRKGDGGVEAVVGVVVRLWP